ncbi:MAG: ABC transporter permease [Planctomycetota bacterium]|nr:MAG: ABC transporter permease [Planctomycetota bacterium]
MRSIWAVATNTIRQALRMKVALIFTILLLVLLPVMALSMPGDGTIKGRLQAFVSYGLSLTSLLLCLLTIVVSIYTLTNDIKQKQIFTVLTKPVRRFQLLLGKLLGVILLDVVLLALFSAIIYTITIYTPKLLNAGEEELISLNNEFFTARASLTPPKIDVTQEVLETYNKLKETNQLLPGSSKEDDIYVLTLRKELEKRAVPVGRELVWQFQDVKPLDPNQSLFIRFKYDVSVSPPDLNIYGRWVVGDDRQIKYGTEMKTPIYTFDRKDFIRTFHEIEVPADAVAEDNYLAVGFFNPPLNDTVVIFPTDGGLEMLYKADSFTANFLRAALLILLRLIFLACLGILAASFLSFPVAVLFCLMIFLTGTISSFVLESFDIMSKGLTSFYSYTIRPVVQLLPQFDKFNPTKFLVPARLLSWLFLAKVAGLMVCVKATVLLLLALLIFTYREMAKVII